MKKTMIAASAALVAGVAMAITSQNIVGYQSVTIDKEITALGISFESTTGVSLDIQDAFPYVDGMTKGTGTANADTIRVWDGTTYSAYYMSNGKDAKGGSIGGLEGKWALSGQTEVASKSLPAGSAIWYYSKGYATPYSVSVAGQVFTSANCAISIGQGITFIANPYPGDLLLNDGIPYVDGMTQGTGTANADTIRIWDGTTYTGYYMSNGKDAKGGTVAGLEGKWALSGQTTATTDSIPAGNGAWYYRKDDNATFDIIVASPIQ